MAITEVAWAGWVITVVGWLLSPVIALLLPKIVSRLGLDATKKLRELEIRIISELQQTMRAVDQERMLGRGKKLKSEVEALDKMAAMLRHALEDAEDIFDDAQHKVVTRGCHRFYVNWFCHHLYVASVASLRCLVIVLGRLAELLQRAASVEHVQVNDRHARDDATQTGAAGMRRLLRWAGMVKYGGYCGRLYVAAEGGMWIALQWPGRILRGAVESICTMWSARITRSGSARLLRWARNRFQEPVHSTAASHDLAVDIPEEAVPVATPSESASNEQAIVRVPPPSGSASHEQAALVPVATPSEAGSNEQALVPVATPSEAGSNEQALVPVATSSEAGSNEQALVPVAPPWESASDNEVVSEAIHSGYVVHEEVIEIPFDVFASRCRSILDWLIDKFEAACFYRNWSYEAVGITSNQEDATALDCVLTAISRWNLRKRAKNVESTVSEVKKSPLLGVTSKSASDDIANKNRSRIRSPSTRVVFGREELLHRIMDMLQPPPDDASSSSTSPCYSVIGIYGVAGSGKTTFARYVRDYIEVDIFDTIICIHVSENFSVDDIFREMLKDITQIRHSNISDREDLEDKLKESLRGKRFFLILDDLWVKSRNDSQLEELIAPLNVGSRGSKILVTARTKVAAGALCADEPIELPDLDGDQYFRMFMYYALGRTSDADDEFTHVGRVIVEKLHRSLIAAVIVAGRLGANRDIIFWKNTAELDMLNDIMDCLWWSYQQLSLDIRRCFEYCNIFPRRFQMEKDDLVHLLIAQGFVKTNSAREDMEGVARSYIQELVSYSFLQQEVNLDGIFCFTIHDLLHDLANMVSGTDYYRIENESGQRREDWKQDVPQDVRHLFVQNYDVELITENILVLKNLRTLIIDVVGSDTPVEENVIASICKRLLKLRVLAIGTRAFFPIEQPKRFFVPQSISRLKHLRHFAFRIRHCDKVIYLPHGLNKLHHVQLLDFHYGHISNFNLNGLPNLRHIFFRSGVKLANISKLTSLQTLKCNLIVRDEQGYEVNQLRYLNNLRGNLKINGLGNVKSKEEALEANLASKERITELWLKWDFTGGIRCSPEVEAEVLESLRPPIGLKELHIHWYKGSRYPDWMVGNMSSGPKDLQWMDFWYCSQLGPAPQLVEAFPRLRILRLCHCNWDALPGNMEHLTSLKELVIQVCDNIRSLPTLPYSLYEFRIYYCNAEFMESCQTVGDPNWHMIEHIPRKYFDPSISGEGTQYEVSHDSDDEGSDYSDGIAAQEV